MKIAMVGGFAWEPKGTIRARAFPLAVELAKQGHKVSIFLTPYDNPKYSGSVWDEEGVSIVNLSVPLNLNAHSLMIPFQMKRAIKSFEPHVIHVFKPKGFAGLFAMLVLGAKTPVVLDCDDWEGWGGWNEVTNHSRLVKEFIDLQEKWLTRRCSTVTVASKVLLQRALGFGRSADSTFYLPNCASGAVVRASPTPNQHGLSDAPPSLFYAGHFESADDLEFFVANTSSVARKNNTSVHLVGSGPGLEWVTDEFTRKGVEVFSHGILSYPEYRKILAQCDVAVFPYPDNAVYRAKCSARIIDYMAAGKAVLTTDVGQNPEYIQNNVSGVLIAPGDGHAYISNLQVLLTNPDLRLVLGRNAQKMILEHFLWEIRGIEACNIAYQSALARASKDD